MKFRLANVDAPETGGVGARGGAKCEFERELGYDAKEFMVELTRSADLVITSSSGKTAMSVKSSPCQPMARMWPRRARRPGTWETGPTRAVKR